MKALETLAATLRALADAVEDLPREIAASQIDHVLGYEACARIVGVSLSTFRKRAQRGDVPVVQGEGAAPGVRESDLKQYIRNLPVRQVARGHRREVRKSPRPLRALVAAVR